MLWNTVDVNGKSIYAQKALEVDFIASKGDIKYYIQSALSMDDADKQLQEKRSLYYIDDSFKKIVVAKTGLKPSYDEKGVVIIDLFLEFLNRNNALFRDGHKVISDGALVAITLMIAESDPKEKDIMTTMVMNLLSVG